MNETSKYFGYVHRSNLKIIRNGKYNCEWKTKARRKKRERVKNAIECQCIQSKSGYETKLKEKTERIKHQRQINDREKLVIVCWWSCLLDIRVVCYPS